MDARFAAKTSFQGSRRKKKPAEAGLNESTLRAVHECSLPNERLKVTGATSQSAPAATKPPKVGL